ncbi:MAG TPA: right-handed parallel beta-helix repeat-containing protein [Gemmatimonadales bacterium]|jgi:nitrous oxidase accessory protein NosD
MKSLILVLLLLILPPVTAEAQVRPRAGLIVTRSIRIAPGVYRLAASASLDSALITIRGSNLTVDLSGVTLEGIAPDSDPDQARGVAVFVDGGTNVTIKGAHIRGYKIAILARGTRGLVLADNDVSYSWKPRLFSLVEHESLADWLSFHHNESREWLRFGAAIFLEAVAGGEVRGNRAVQGMNGLMLVRSSGLRVLHNELSFNSGLGIGLYRSSDNWIAYNFVDYDVRGYSHRFYHRGQDSAGILLFEQSCRNVIAWNSVTHGGDGLFLWAGQSTMDSGTGGANDNIVVGNDFSYAPANGIEATFSRNTFAGNFIEGNDYGVWGGYSFGSLISANHFEGNRIGIAIEHGQDDTLADNFFEGDTTAVSLWANPIEPSDWGYPKHRDTRSRNALVEGNVFARNRVAVRAANTAELTVRANGYSHVDSFAVMRDTSAARLEDNKPDEHFAWMPLLPGDVGGPGLSDLEGRHLAPVVLPRRDRSAIVVDEWGPYDWRSPRLWPLDSTHAHLLPLAVLGPPLTWRVVERRGTGDLSRASGKAGDTIVVTPPDPADWGLVLEATSDRAMTTPRGRVIRAGAPYRFSYGRFEPRVDWSVRFFTWADSTSPVTHAAAFDALLDGTSIVTRSESRLDYMWYRPTIPDLPQDHFATVATGSVTLAPGDYTLRTISDDAIRVWVDGRLVIDDWTPHESAVDNAPISAGSHQIRVVHYQVDGWTELRLDIVRGRQSSKGSPGPH